MNLIDLLQSVLNPPEPSQSTPAPATATTPTVSRPIPVQVAAPAAPATQAVLPQGSFAPGRLPQNPPIPTPRPDMPGGVPVTATQEPAGAVSAAPGSQAPQNPLEALLMGPQAQPRTFGNMIRAAGAGMANLGNTGGDPFVAFGRGFGGATTYSDARDQQRIEQAAAARKLALDEQLAQQKLAGGGVSYGKTPVWGTDPKSGKPVLGVIGDDGSFKRVDTSGVDLSTGLDKIDAGTHWVLIDKRSGEIVGTMPKENYQEAYDKSAGSEAGKSYSEGAATAPQDIQKSLQTVQQIDELLDNPGFDSVFGQFDQFRPSWTMGNEGRDALARYNQLKGKAFLEAYTMLKGGGQITEVEGTKAEAAMVRLDRAQDENAARKALEDFRDAVVEGTRKLQKKYGVGGDIPAAAPTGGAGGLSGTTSGGLQWSIE